MHQLAHRLHPFQAQSPASSFCPNSRRIDSFQTYVLGAAESNAGDARHAGQVQLLEGLAGLLLVAVVDDGGRAGGQVGLAILVVGLVAAVVLVDGGTLGLVVGKLFDSGVGHFDGLYVTASAG